MVQRLAYLNIGLSVAYALIYLKNGTFNSTSGVLVIVVFSWLGLRSYQLDQYKWNALTYLVGLWSLYFIGTVVYGLINVISSAFEFSYIANDTLWYVAVSVIFSVSLTTYLAVYWLKNYREISP